MKILNFGSLNLDYVYAVDHFVAPGETLSASSQSLNPGGKGLNQSIALAKAGANVYHAGCAGVGGEFLLKTLAENGVNIDYIDRCEEMQGNAIIQVTPQGENAILLFGGSNQCITRAQIDRVLADFDAGDYLLLQNEVNELGYMVDRAFEKSMKIILNPSPYDEKLKAVDFAKLSWLLINEVESSQISGEDDPDAAWSVLHERYPDLSAVITLGKQGCIAYQTREKSIIRHSHPAFPVQAVDTTAAGDTFTGYFLAGLMKGTDLVDCLQKASVASAISVTRHGAAPSIPVETEVDDCLLGIQSSSEHS